MTNGKKLLGATVTAFLVVTVGSVALANGTDAREQTVAEEVIVVEQPSPPSDQYIIDVQVAALNDFLAEQNRIEAEKAAAAEAAAVKARQASSSQAGVYTNSSPNDFLACVKQRESGGNYGAYNPSGAGGAYQMMPSTANTVANWMDRPDLVGIGAQNWAPADQDAGALILYERLGKNPWYYPPKPC